MQICLNLILHNIPRINILFSQQFIHLILKVGNVQDVLVKTSDLESGKPVLLR